MITPNGLSVFAVKAGLAAENRTYCGTRTSRIRKPRFAERMSAKGQKQTFQWTLSPKADICPAIDQIPDKYHGDLFPDALTP